MAYCSASDVFSYSQNLAHGQPTFNAETLPTLNQVTRFMSSGCAAIHTKMAEAGWDTPVASGTDLYERLIDLNALFAAGRSELTRVNVTVGPGERTRGQIFLDLFKMELDELVNSNLAEIGGEVSSTDGEIFVGGISVASKDSYDDDSDRVQPRFKRNQFKFSESQYPD